MSFGKYLALDDKLVKQTQEVAALNADAHSAILRGALSVLEGTDAAEVESLSEQLGLSAEMMSGHSQAVASLMWEFVKSSPSDETAITTALQSVGIADQFSNLFAQSYFENRRRLAALKGSLNISACRYIDLSWRLDMELARRHLTSVLEPKFQVRLDVLTPAGEDFKTQSHHLEADYANLKKLYRELQAANDEFTSTHSQRITRYII